MLQEPPDSVSNPAEAISGGLTMDHLALLDLGLMLARQLQSFGRLGGQKGGRSACEP